MTKVESNLIPNNYNELDQNFDCNYSLTASSTASSSKESIVVSLNNSSRIREGEGRQLSPSFSSQACYLASLSLCFHCVNNSAIISSSRIREGEGRW
mmetsp:Transcript_20125/g.21575  ORF Transcript_20125/g.21575 Transcript_20125/m.21575 type:complete len:97 (+) Transcript_20125:250-540(+)